MPLPLTSGASAHNAIELAPLILLKHNRNTFAFRARIGAKVIVGTAKVDISVFQPKPGEEYASAYAQVSYER